MGHTVKVSKGNRTEFIDFPQSNYVDSPSNIDGDLASCALFTFFCIGESDGRGITMTEKTITPIGFALALKKQGFDVEILNPQINEEVLP